MAGYIVAAVVQEVVSRTFSVVLGKRKDKASQGQYVERLRKAVHAVEFVLERTEKMLITDVSLLRERFKLKSGFIDRAACLLSSRSKKRQSPQGQEQISQVVTYSSFPRGRCPAMFSVSSFIDTMTSEDELRLSCDDVEKFEKFADSAKDILTRVESVCSFRCHTDFWPYPFVRQLLQGKTLKYQRIQGGQRLMLEISPLILEGRGVEARLLCVCFDPERLDKSFYLDLMLRISESMDIVGTAIDCLRWSALQAPDAIIRELTLLSTLQDKISSTDCYDPLLVREYSFFSLSDRRDPLCCQSELSQIFPEQIINFYFSCHIPALEYSLPIASDEAGRNVMADRPPLKQSVFFQPHRCLSRDVDGWVREDVGGKSEDRPFGDIQQTSDMVRSRSVDCLIHQPETTKYSVYWFSRHGSAHFEVEKPSVDMVAGTKARGRYNTRSSAKRNKRAEKPVSESRLHLALRRLNASLMRSLTA